MQKIQHTPGHGLLQHPFQGAAVSLQLRPVVLCPLGQFLSVSHTVGLEVHYGEALFCLKKTVHHALQQNGISVS